MELFRLLFKRWVTVLVGITMGLVPPLLVAADSRDYSESGMQGAKAIFESGEGPSFVAQKKSASPGKPSPKPYTGEKYMGVAYWIDLLTPDGRHVVANKNRIFRSGEKFKLNVKANRDGYLYVMNIGSTGRTHVLFPSSSDVDNRIRAHQTYSIPHHTHMKFDNNPGEETLLVMLSPRPMDDVAPASPSPTFESRESRTVVAYAHSKGAKDIIVEDEVAGSSKDIVLEGEATAQNSNYVRYASEVSSYTVAPLSSLEKNGGVISIFVKLKHR